MASRYTREQLEGLRRVDLQKIGKGLGLKANLKSEELINLILAPSAQTQATAGPSKPPSRPTSRATTKPPSVRTTAGPAPRARDVSVAPETNADTTDGTAPARVPSEAPQPAAPAKPSSTVTVSKPSSTVSRTSSLFSMRAVSSRMPSAAFGRSRDLSQSTVIDHGEDEHDGAAQPTVTGEGSANSDISSHPPPAVLPRRKAKDTQFRLGVGRPMLAGGSGARNITASVNVVKGKMPAREMTRSEPTIAEEVGDEPDSTPAQPSGADAPVVEPTAATTTDTPVIPKHVPYIGSAPVLDVIALKTEYDRQVSSMREEIDGLQSAVKFLMDKVARMDAVEEEVRGLRTQLRLITNAPNTGNINTNHSNSDTDFDANSAAASTVAPPPIPTQHVVSKKAYPSTLGKANGYAGLGKHLREPSPDSTQAESSDAMAHENKRTKLGDKTPLFRVEGDEDDAHGPARPIKQATPSPALAFKVFEGPDESEASTTTAVSSHSGPNALDKPSDVSHVWPTSLGSMLPPPTPVVAPPTPALNPSTRTPSNSAFNFLGTSPWAGFGGLNLPRPGTPPMTAREGALLGLPAMHDLTSPSERGLKVIHRVDGVDTSYDPEDRDADFWSRI